VIEFRAFRGTRRSSVYRSHAIADGAFRRIVDASAVERLPALQRLEAGAELDAANARGLAAELTQLRSSAALVDLDSDLAAIAAVANWCAHARGSAWLTVN
jgi:hypothetical protein